jgi:hypothetical protein
MRLETLKLPSDLGKPVHHFYNHLWTGLGWMFEHGVVMLGWERSAWRVRIRAGIEIPRGDLLDFNFANSGSLLIGSTLLHNIFSPSPRLREVSFAGLGEQRGASGFFFSWRVDADAYVIHQVGSHIYRRAYRSEAEELLLSLPKSEHRGEMGVLISVHPTNSKLVAIRHQGRIFFEEILSPTKTRVLCSLEFHRSWSWTRLGGLTGPYSWRDLLWRRGLDYFSTLSQEEAFAGERTSHHVEDFRGDIWSISQEGSLVLSHSERLEAPKIIWEILPGD